MFFTPSPVPPAQAHAMSDTEDTQSQDDDPDIDETLPLISRRASDPGPSIQVFIHEGRNHPVRFSGATLNLVHIAAMFDVSSDIDS